MAQRVVELGFRPLFGTLILGFLVTGLCFSTYHKIHPFVCTVQWILVYSQSCDLHQNIIFELFQHSKEKPVPVSSLSLHASFLPALSYR